MSDEAAPAQPPDAQDSPPKREVVSSFSKFVAPPKNSWSGALQMGTMVLVMQLNLKLQANVMLVQTVFAIVAAVVYLVSSKMPSIVPLESSASTVTVFYPAEDPLQNADNPLAQFIMGSGDEQKATKWEKLTLAELETKLAQKRKTAAMSLLMPAFVSWFLGIHYLAATQVRSAWRAFPRPLVDAAAAGCSSPTPPPPLFSLSPTGRSSLPPSRSLTAP